MFELDAAIYWHGRIMVFVWAAMFPISVLIARFFKITPKQDFPKEHDNQFWWICHLLFQYIGGILIVVAVYLVVTSATNLDQLSRNHRILGWLTVTMCALQFVSGWLRGSKGGPTDRRSDGSLFGDHYFMTRRRRAFEALHKSNGYLALLLSSACILTGLSSVNAPLWMPVTLICWWALLIGTFVLLQASGRQRDTFAAIWGLPYRETEHAKKSDGK